MLPGSGDAGGEGEVAGEAGCGDLEALVVFGVVEVVDEGPAVEEDAFEVALGVFEMLIVGEEYGGFEAVGEAGGAEGEVFADEILLAAGAEGE